VQKSLLSLSRKLDELADMVEATVAGNIAAYPRPLGFERGERPGVDVPPTGDKLKKWLKRRRSYPDVAGPGVAKAIDRYIHGPKESLDELKNLLGLDEAKKQKTNLVKGDLIKYSRRFLQSTGMYTGDAPHATGRVIALHDLGGMALVEIEWLGGEPLPRRVLATNLVKVSDLHKEESLKEGWWGVDVESAGDEQMVSLLYPDRREVAASEIMQWAEDAYSDGKIDHKPENLQDAIDMLSDIGFITVAREKRYRDPVDEKHEDKPKVEMKDFIHMVREEPGFYEFLVDGWGYPGNVSAEEALQAMREWKKEKHQTEEVTEAKKRWKPSSEAAKAFISKEIEHLIKDKGYERERAVAAAYSVAKEKFG